MYILTDPKHVLHYILSVRLHGRVEMSIFSLYTYISLTDSSLHIVI